MCVLYILYNNVYIQFHNCYFLNISLFLPLSPIIYICVCISMLQVHVTNMVSFLSYLRISENGKGSKCKLHMGGFSFLSHHQCLCYLCLGENVAIAQITWPPQLYPGYNYMHLTFLPALPISSL